MKGLAVKEIKLSEVFAHPEARAEAEFYLAPNGVQKNYVLGEVAIPFVQYGTSDELNDEGIGFPVLRLNEISNGFVEDAEKSCASLTAKDFAELQLKRGDVLVCRTNGNPRLVGKAGLAMEDAKTAFASYLFRARPDPAVISSAALMIFLNSLNGRLEVEKHSIRSNQVNFSPERLRQSRVPRFGITFLHKIDSIVESAYLQRRKTEADYKEGETLLLKALNLHKWNSPEPLTYIRRASEAFTAARLDAEYFQPKYQALIDAMKPKSADYQVVPLQSLTEPLKYGCSEPLEYMVDGRIFLRIADLRNKQFQLDSVKRVPIGHPFNESDVVKLNDVLISRSGTLGIAVPVTAEFANSAYGSYFIRTRPDTKIIHPEFLALFINSFAGQLQVEGKNSGGVQMNPTIPAIESLMIPLGEMKWQMQFVSHIEAAHAARQRAQELLAAAQRAVEIAIEDSEPAALAHLKTQGA